MPEQIRPDLADAAAFLAGFDSADQEGAQAATAMMGWRFRKPRTEMNEAADLRQAYHAT
jgi:hypothetical protein